MHFIGIQISYFKKNLHSHLFDSDEIAKIEKKTALAEFATHLYLVYACDRCCCYRTFFAAAIISFPEFDLDFF